VATGNPAETASSLLNLLKITRSAPRAIALDGGAGLRECRCIEIACHRAGTELLAAKLYAAACQVKPFSSPSFCPHSVVHYENLVRDPPATLKTNLEPIGLSFDPRQLAWAEAEKHEIAANSALRRYERARARRRLAQEPVPAQAARNRFRHADLAADAAKDRLCALSLDKAANDLSRRLFAGLIAFDRPRRRPGKNLRR